MKLGSMEPIVNISSLHIRYGALVLNLGDFSIFQGETVCLVGPSGCGKSSLAKLIAANQLIAAEAEEFDVREWEKGVGYAPQSDGLLERASIKGQIARLLKKADKTRNGLLEKALQSLELNDRIMRSTPAELSGGEKARCKFALALVNAKSFLILDETFSGLNATLKNRCYELIQEVKEQGVTTILISHDLLEVYRIADKVYRLGNCTNPLFKLSKTVGLRNRTDLSSEEGKSFIDWFSVI